MSPSHTHPHPPTPSPSYFDIALDIWQKSLPSNHPDLITVFKNISETYYIMDDYVTALSYLQEILKKCQTSLPSNQALLSTIYGNMAAIFDKLHQNEEAIKYTEQSVECARHSLGVDHTETKQSENYLDQLREKYGENADFKL